MRKKRLYPAIYFTCFTILTLILFTGTNPQAEKQKRKVYTFNHNQLKPLMKFKAPSKYKSLWKELLNSKKNGSNPEEILEKHGLDLDKFLGEMKIKNKPKEYLRELILGKNPIIAIVQKGSGTAPKGTVQYDIVYGVRYDIDRILRKYTDSIKFKIVFYPGGVLGDEPDFIRKIKLGELQWCGGQMIMGQMVAPELSVFDFPFLYDYEPGLYWDELKYCQLDWIWGKTSSSINKLLAKRGFILGGIMDGGCWYAIATKNHPLKREKNFSKLTYPLLVGSRIAPEIKKAMGYRKVIASRVWDLSTYSATGMINSMICAYYWQVLLQTAPYYKYVTDYPLDGFSAGIVIVDKSLLGSMIRIIDNFGFFMGLQRKDAIAISRELILSINKTLKTKGRKVIRKAEGETRRKLLASGKLKLVHFPRKELEKVKKKILPLYNKLADKKGAYPKWFLEEILKYREEYRKLKKAGKLARWQDDGIYPDGYDEWSWIREWTP